MYKKPFFRCGLEITGSEHGEWQGILQTDDENLKFCSVMELLSLIRSRAGPPFEGRKEK
jgi:hypothetical protein